MREIWRDVPGYEGIYSVSNWGRLRREKGSPHQPRETMIIKLQSDKEGYFNYRLSKNGKGKMIKIHRLVMAVFVGHSPLPVNHIDGNKSNNCVSNLCYVTPKENTQHALQNGLLRKGSQVSWAKVTEAEVIQIRLEYATGKILQHELGKRYGVSYKTIGKIIRRERWKHI